MKKFRSLLLRCGAALAALLPAAFTACTPSTNIRRVDAAAFAQCIADTAAVVRLDVRTPAEYDAGHIPGAINIDVQAAGFEQEALRRLPRRTIALYCRSGRRSRTAAELLAGHGYNVVELQTGFLGWTAAGMPVEPASAAK